MPGPQQLLREVILENKDRAINPDLIREFHRNIGKNLGKHFDAIPGQFREDSRIVGPYLAPDYRNVPSMIDNLCE